MAIVKCENCSKNFDKEQKYINAAIKKGRKHFCCISCSTSYRNTTKPNTNHSSLPQNQKGYKQKRYSKFSWYLSRCRSRKRDNGITVEMLERLWEKQKGLCAISNISLYLHDDCSNQLYLASLDRIDSSLPYQENNIQFVAYPLNLAKNAFSNDKFTIFLKEVAQSLSL